jgi:transcriptional regulator with XRE-family HTH domain
MELWDGDVPHVGELVRLIRESRGLSQTDFGKLRGRDKSSINKFERGGAVRFKTFLDIIKAFISESLPRHQRLNNNQFQTLLNMHSYNKNREDLAKLYAELDIQIIRDNPESLGLEGLVENLEESKYPAFIMDSLWFIHVTNGALWHLFETEFRKEELTKDDYIYNWEAWHVLATKYHPDSRVRLGHTNRDVYFPPAIVQFFIDDFSTPFFFTCQYRSLVDKVVQLSNRHGFQFATWWYNGLCFNLPYEGKAFDRTLLYKDKRIHARSEIEKRHRERRRKGFDVTYHLVVWYPDSSDSEDVFEQIARQKKSRHLCYAADYDDGNFHVNTWPEVQAEMTLLRS